MPQHYRPDNPFAPTQYRPDNPFAPKQYRADNPFAPEEDPSVLERIGGFAKGAGEFGLGTLAGLGGSVTATARGLAGLLGHIPESAAGGLAPMGELARAAQQPLTENVQALQEAVPEGIPGAVGGLGGRLAGDLAQIGLTGGAAGVAGLTGAAAKAGVGAVGRGALISAPLAATQALGGEESSTAALAAELLPEDSQLQSAFEEIADSPIERAGFELVVDVALGGLFEKGVLVLKTAKARRGARKALEHTRATRPQTEQGLARLSAIEDQLKQIEGTRELRAQTEPGIARLREVEEPIRHRQAVEALEPQPRRADVRLGERGATDVPEPGLIDLEAGLRQEPSPINVTGREPRLGVDVPLSRETSRVTPGAQAVRPDPLTVSLAREQPTAPAEVPRATLDIEGRGLGRPEFRETPLGEAPRAPEHPVRLDEAGQPRGMGRPMADYDQRGFISRDAMEAITGTVAGATIGGVVAEDPLTGVVVGGLVGAAGPSAARRAVQTNVGQGVRAFMRRNFTSRGDLPDEVFQRWRKMQGSTTAHLSEMTFTTRRFRSTAKRVYGKKGPDDKTLKQIDAALKGDQRALRGLPEEMQLRTQEMRRHIDSLSRGLVDSGAVEGRLVAAVTNNLGTYATRSYRIFSDPDWAERVPLAIRNKAKALVRSELATQGYHGRALDQQAENVIDRLLYIGKEAGGPMDFLTRGSKISKDLSILRRRKGIPPEIRALWGEFDDPLVNYTRSVNKMADLLEKQRFLNELKETQLGRALFERGDPEGVGAVTRIATDKSKVLSPLEGLYTFPEFKAALDDIMDSPALGTWYRRYMKVNGFVKFAKTVGSPTTHIRNTVGNTGFYVANGHFLQKGRRSSFKAGIQAVKASVGGSDQGWQEYVKKLERLSVFNQSAREGEIRDVLRDALKTGLDDPSASIPVMRLKQAANLAATAYRAEDDVWKVIAFESEKVRYARALPHLSEAELENRVARIVSDTFPTYNLVPRGVRLLRRFPLAGNFVSFPAEVMRTGHKTISLALTELRDPALRQIGLQRLAGITAAALGVGGAAMTSRYLLGISGEEDEDLRRFMAPWSRNSNLIHVGKDPNGVSRAIDVSYTDPYSYLRKPIIAIMRGEDWESALMQAGAELFSPYMDEEILAAKLLNIKRNRTAQGGRVFNPEDDFVDQSMDAFKHILDALEPGGMTGFRRVLMGLTGKTTPYGRSYNPAIEAAAQTTGMRVTEINVRQGFPFKVSDTNKRMRDAEELLGDVARRRGTVSDRELLRAYRESEQAREQVWNDVARDVEAARRLGMTEREVRQALKNGRWSTKQVNDLMRGRFRPKQFTDRFLAGVGLDRSESRRRRRLLRGFQGN